MSRIIAGVQIDKHVPMSKVRCHGRWLKVLYALEVSKDGKSGESFLVESQNVANGLYTCARQKNMKIRAEKQDSGKVRVWRVK